MMVDWEKYWAYIKSRGYSPQGRIRQAKSRGLPAGTRLNCPQTPRTSKWP
ncbi:MAG TPA: hypothetical protein PK985_07500 [Bacillota bacterium]|nr:hypothetical protein [Bacillota bacterium]